MPAILSTAARDRVASTAPELVVRRWRRRSRARAALICALLLAGVVALVALTSTIGSYGVPVRDVFPAVVGIGDPMTVYVVQEIRLPRSAVAFAVGLAFGISGALFQSLARNPLASPDIIGIASGASFGAVLVLYTVGASATFVPLGAFAGSTAAASVIVAFSWRRSISPMRLILVGIGVQAMGAAVIGLLLARAREDTLEQATRWLSGSISGRGWTHAAAITAALIVLVPLAVTAARPLSVLQLGEPAARGAGVAAGRWQLIVILLGCALCTAGVTVAGPVTLIAFLGPPIARRLVRSPGPALLTSAMVSAAILVVADLVARIGLGTLHLPVGLITGAIGAPVLLYTLLRRPGGARHG